MAKTSPVRRDAATTEMVNGLVGTTEERGNPYLSPHGSTLREPVCLLFTRFDWTAARSLQKGDGSRSDAMSCISLEAKRLQRLSKRWHVRRFAFPIASFVESLNTSDTINLPIESAQNSPDRAERETLNTGFYLKGKLYVQRRLSWLGHRPAGGAHESKRSDLFINENCRNSLRHPYLSFA